MEQENGLAMKNFTTNCRQIMKIEQNLRECFSSRWTRLLLLGLPPAFDWNKKKWNEVVSFHSNISFRELKIFYNETRTAIE